MNCEQVDRLLIDSLIGDLGESERQELEEHLGACKRCRIEAVELEGVWQDLGDLESSDPEVPSGRLMRRFRLSLADYEANLTQRRPNRFLEWWSGMWELHPAWQGAFSAALIVIGVVIGAGLTAGRQTTRSEVDALRAEMETMSRAVSVSLLQHQSASERLRAVSWSRRAGGDGEVLSALLAAAREDPNVNVRLAAIDALAVHAEQGPVRAGLIETLERADSPLVQLAVLEVVAGERGLANGELQKLIDSGEVDPTVLEHFAEQAESL